MPVDRVSSRYRLPRWLLIVVTLVALSSLAATTAGRPAAQPGDPSASPSVATPAGTPAATQGATPSAATPSAAEPLACSGPCLVRFASGADLDAALTATGMRPAFATAEVVWVGGTPEDLGTLVAAGPVPQAIVSDAPSLALYALTDGPSRPNEAVVSAFGELIDQAGPTSIVRAPSVPAYALDVIAAGMIIAKVEPYVPAGTPSLARGATDVPGVEQVIETVPDTSVAEVERTLLDLSSAGAEPGTLGSRFFSLPGNVAAAEYLYLRFAAYGLTTWYEDYVASNGVLSLNVVAEIPGEKDGPIWAAFAHFDTIADDTPGNDIAPGALDNGTGLATLLESARVLSGYRLTYPVRFVALNGEEVGLQGSREFGARAASEGTPYGGGINVDSVGTAYGYRVLYVNTSAEAAFIQDILVDVYEANGFQLNIAVLQTSTIVADEVPLTQAGIPTILVASMLYGDPLINCSCDTIDGVDIDYTRATARLVMLTLAVLASP